MSQKEIAFKIEELMVNVEKLYSLQNVLFAALYYSNGLPVSDMEWAFVLLGDMTANMLDELKELTDSAFDNMRGE